MDRHTTRVAAASAVLVAAAMLLGALALPRILDEPLPAPAPAPEPEPRLAVGTEPLPVLEAGSPGAPPPSLADLSIRIGRLEAAVARLEDGRRALEAELGGALTRLRRATTALRLGGLPGGPAERAAVATLRNSTSAQAQVQATGRVDTDRDGVGEYGGFLEMSGRHPGRMDRVLVPPVLPRAFRTMQDGAIVRGGYCYRIFLPGPRGAGVAEPERGFADDGTIDPDLAETTWCMYAWPLRYGETGTRTFFVNQAGDTLATDAEAYSGPAGGPAAEAAFLPSGGSAITGAVAIGVKGNDGNVWAQAR